jgi:hypothetical protein
MKKLLDVSHGQPPPFAVNGSPVVGIIVSSRQQPGTCAAVCVRTDGVVPSDAKLTIPSLPETGGCGLAQPLIENQFTFVELLIGYSHVDVATIGK